MSPERENAAVSPDRDAVERTLIATLDHSVSYELRAESHPHQMKSTESWDKLRLGTAAPDVSIYTRAGDEAAIRIGPHVVDVADLAQDYRAFLQQRLVLAATGLPWPCVVVNARQADRRFVPLNLFGQFAAPRSTQSALEIANATREEARSQEFMIEDKPLDTALQGFVRGATESVLSRWAW